MSLLPSHGPTPEMLRKVRSNEDKDAAVDEITREEIDELAYRKVGIQLVAEFQFKNASQPSLPANERIEVAGRLPKD